MAARQLTALRFALFVCSAVVGSLPASLDAAEDLSDPDAAVEAAREGLDSYWGPAWYSGESDSFKPLNVPPPAKPWGFWEWLESVFSSWSWDVAGILRVLGWIVVIAAFALIVYAVVRAAQNAELRGVERVDEEEDGRTHIERVEALPVALERPVGDFLIEAKRLFDAGELTLAIVYLFSYQLVELDKRRLLRLVKGKTNRKYVREVRKAAPSHPGIARELERTVLVFERAFFGAHAPDAETVRRQLEGVEALLAEADRAWEASDG